MARDAHCVFCKRIAAGEYDYADARCVAFRPLNPVTPGHFLVVPRRHVAHALESPLLAGKALEYAGYLANAMDLPSANFITSAGAPATQTVFHLHVHVVPRREADGLALPWTSNAIRAAQRAADAQLAEAHLQRRRLVPRMRQQRPAQTR